ncbi:ATP-binding protein [Streptomyces sp. NPDC002742]|uniref:ATP-binding protein n=1 Tax=Streptomyces sp. NPDC002742 TaxID=3364663 RepID=UPI0036AEDB65
MLNGHGMAHIAVTAESPASELVANAYRHSAGPATLRLRAPGSGRPRGSRPRVGVWGADPRIPSPFDKRHGTPSPVPAEAGGGRGLFLVCHYAHAWDRHPLVDDLFGRNGEVLWCEAGPPRVAAPERVSA